MIKKLLKIFLILAITGLDQLIKHLTRTAWPEFAELIPGFLNLRYVENYGVAFGLLSGARFPISIITGVTVIVMIVFLFRFKIINPWGEWGITLLCGGAVGNLIDRVFRGSVTDMFEFDFINFAIFNVADIFITTGGIMLVIYFLMTGKKEAEMCFEKQDEDRDK